LITSAPKSASVCVQAGPATTRVKSTTSKPSRAVGTPFPRGVRSDSCGLEVMILFLFSCASIGGHWQVTPGSAILVSILAKAIGIG
jgi:hypothetical protein